MTQWSVVGRVTVLDGTGTAATVYLKWNVISWFTTRHDRMDGCVANEWIDRDRA